MHGESATFAALITLLVCDHMSCSRGVGTLSYHSKPLTSVIQCAKERVLLRTCVKQVPFTNVWAISAGCSQGVVKKPNLASASSVVTERQCWPRVARSSLSVWVKG